MRKRYILTIAAALCSVLTSVAQSFINLTAEQVKIDSLLPYFSYSHPLHGNFADSVYTVEIAYPEFIDMHEADIRRYRRITADTLPELPVVEQYISIARKQGLLEFSFVPLVFRDGKYRKLVSFKLNITSAPRYTAGGRQAMRKAPASAAERYAAHSVLKSGQWAKIRVPASGIYQLTDEVVRRAGFTDLSKVKIYGYGGALVPEKLTADYLTAYDDLKEVPTCMAGGKRLFYAQGPVSWNGSKRVRNPYSDHGYYFITQSSEAPLTETTEEFAARIYPSADDYNSLYEKDNYSWIKSGRNIYDAQEFASGASISYTLTAPGTSATGTLTVVLSAKNRTVATISLNDSVVGTVIPRETEDSSKDSYCEAFIKEKTFRVKNLKETNTVKITKEASENAMRLDYISLHSDSPKPAPDLATLTPPVPEYVYNITNQDLHADTPVDMVIILPTTQKLRAQAERLKAYHEQYDSMTVRIVPADELFNEFSSGTPDASAYRRYMKMLYDRAEDAASAPKYLLLFGDGAWDNRMVLPAWNGYSPDDFLLCFESENSYSHTESYVSDDFFCMLDDEEQIEQLNTYGKLNYYGKPDVAVGRMSVRTETEAQTVVDKVINYASRKYAGAWQNTLVFMGDDGDSNAHMRDINSVAEMVEKSYPAYNIKRIMWDTFTRISTSTGARYPDVTRLVKQYMNNGALMMNYAGHGAAYCMSHELSITLAEFKEATSTNLPLWVTASCDIMPFDGQEENLGEEAMFNTRGGAVAFFGTPRTVFSSFNTLLNLAFTEEVLKSGVSIGEAARRAKCAMVSTGRDITANKLQYTLLGDPALKLACPEPLAVIDSIDGRPAAEGDTLTLKAGQVVTVKGTIRKGAATDTLFNGVLTATVRDARALVECKLNDITEAKTPYKYYDRTQTLFNGSNNVVRGEFTFTFVVPKDISYGTGTGQILVYAINDSKTTEAQGTTTMFRLNGAETLDRDSVGPSVYCYLNSTSFSNGGSVNPTPYFVAEISDEDGINASGNGIGHDLQLVIDGDMMKTYILNDYFTYEFGSYKKGTVGFMIPELAPGQHKLKFRVWDILNNPATSELTFNVVGGLEPTLFDVDCLNNPATTSTAFRIIHDRVGCTMDFVLDIFDLSGRHLWSYTENGASSDNTYTINWDLTVDNGRQLGTGVYMYRVRMSCDGSSYASKAKKMIVISNK
jgi:hypothetical protein